MADETPLMGLATAVADGVPVDWNAAESAAQSADDVEIVRTLRLIAMLGGVHRTAWDDVESPSATVTQTVLEAPRAVPSWGHFALLERLGEGMQGEVFHAIDTKLDRAVALKFLKSTGTTASAESVLREARLLARVRHPNVVTVYGADLIDGRVGLWMELIAGATLDTLVSRSGPMSATEAAIVGIDVCRALAAVHGAGLLHRDIKPQNVMRESGGRFVLMDFGTGHDLHEDADAQGRFGTPLYMAPEVLAGKAATVQSDVYAVGVLLFYLSTGAYPVSGKTVRHLVDAHSAGERKNLIDTRGDLPESFRRVVERAIHPDPGSRFRSVQEMADALADVVTTATAPRAVAAPPARRRWMASAVIGLAIVAIAGGLYSQRSRPSPIQGPITLAVLPFQDLSSDSSVTYLAEGLADQLITDLGQRTNMTVIARTSSRQFLGTRALVDIARDSNVNAVVEGSVRPQADDLIVTIRVIAASTGAVLSSRTVQQHRKQLGDISPVLAAHVSETLKSPERLNARGAAQIRMDASALEAYFRGWNEYRRLSRDGFKEARRLFEQTVAAQPDFAPAHAALAYVTYTLAVSYRELPVDEALASARREIQLALTADPNSALAHATAGWIKFYGEWDWKGAEDLLRRAVELNPSDPQVHWIYAQLLLVQNRLDAGLQEAQLAQRLDPLNPSRHSNVSTALYYSRRYEDAAREARLLLAQDPNAAIGHFGLARFLTAMGRHDEAAVIIKTALNAREPPIRAELARILLAAGRDREALTLMPEIEADYRSGRLAPEYFAFVVLARGDAEHALQLIHEAVERRTSAVIWINVDPRYDGLRSDERFVELLRTMKLAS